MLRRAREAHTNDSAGSTENASLLPRIARLESALEARTAPRGQTRVQESTVDLDTGLEFEDLELDYTDTWDEGDNAVTSKPLTRRQARIIEREVRTRSSCQAHVYHALIPGGTTLSFIGGERLATLRAAIYVQVPPRLVEPSHTSFRHDTKQSRRA